MQNSIHLSLPIILAYGTVKHVKISRLDSKPRGQATKIGHSSKQTDTKDKKAEKTRDGRYQSAADLGYDFDVDGLLCTSQPLLS